MHGEPAIVLLRLLLAALAGALIGIERTLHGRPAGFRTHTLVCAASALLMLLTVFQWDLLAGAPLETVRVDPTRMAQGIMTGIGFLGAGVILKERLAVRGLTTAASIWMTASIGIILGMGLYLAGALATALTLGVLAVFRWIEDAVPSLRYAWLELRCPCAECPDEARLRELCRAQGVRAGAMSYQRHPDGSCEFRMTVRTRDPRAFGRLAGALRAEPGVEAFSITPAGA